MWEHVFFYRERGLDPSFWAEPVNAWSNLAFLLAAIFAARLAHQRNALDDHTTLLVGLAGMVAIGSFIFHTTARSITMWLDIIPIALFQIACLWLVGTRILDWHRVPTAIFIVSVIGISFLSLPLRPILNGSLFYVPALVALLIVGVDLIRRAKRERCNILIAAFVFLIALIARTVDRSSPWPLGTHFLWHLLNGLVIYLTLRVWIVNQTRSISSTGATSESQG